MSEFKVYCANFNSVLDGVMERLEKTGCLADNYHQADCFLLWQDVRGNLREIAQIAQHQLHKPVVVMQHGRGAVRDYGPPSNLPLQADKICVWGESERQRLLSYGISDSRISVTGCPLLPMLKPKTKERQGKNILFVPVISTKEEPENILVYAALKAWESNKLIETVQNNFAKMKRGWAWENNEVRRIALPDGKTEDRLWKKEVINKLPRWLTYGAGLVNVKLTGLHDQHQYMAPAITSNQGDEDHLDAFLELLINTDVLVCLEEGTMQLLACALDIPVIVVDIFRYENYGGVKNYDEIEKISTNACYHTNNIEKLGGIIDHALKNPQELRKNRIKVVEHEAGAALGDIHENVINAIRSTLKEKQPYQLA